MSDYRKGYVKYINVDHSDGVMKVGVSANSDPQASQPDIWFNIWPSSGSYSDLAKQMILNLRYAYIYGVEADLYYSENNGAFTLDSVDIAWNIEVNS